MGTRGFITFVVDGEEKTTYNHCDSYPDGLGVNVLNFLPGSMIGLTAAREKAAVLKLVTDEVPPTEDQQKALKRYARTGVGRQSRDDWYCLLRETQGNPRAILDAGYMLDAKDFPTDSLFAEYGYVIDFDREVFEAYEGFQHSPHQKGRFADREPKQNASGTYYPVALVASWPLGALPTHEEFLAVFEDGDES
ncbi:hypothetical protein AB0M54_24540 [Actinoplanes sp. NPDC051470]|uniref:hypothetical protein n=1 Tax=Actinoplanes sp. NPDC051470 TaxID=3157224 RepID=UPI00341DBC9A